MALPKAKAYLQVPGHAGAVRIIQPEGSGACGVCLMGEAGGAQEQADGLPFRPYAEAGSVLQAALRPIGVHRSNYLITNTVWWQPKNNWLAGAPWEKDAQAFCRPWNREIIQKARIKVIVALGVSAFQELTGLTDFGVLTNRGYVFQASKDYFELPVVYTYHPSFLARGSKEKNEETGGKTEKAQGGGMALLGVLIRDIRLARGIALKGVPEDWPSVPTGIEDPEKIPF